MKTTSIRKNRILLLLSAFSLWTLCVKPNYVDITLSFCIFLILCILDSKKAKEFSANDTVVITSLSMALICMIAYCFYNRWESSSSVERIAYSLSLDVTSFLLIVAVVFAFFSILVLNRIVRYVLLSIDMLHCKLGVEGASTILIIIVTFIQFSGIQYSYSNYPIITNSYIARWVFNVGAFLLFNIVLIIIVRNTRIALIISSVFFFLWSSINNYVTLFHGNPLLFTELKNVLTAINVIEGYAIVATTMELFTIAYFIIEVALAVLFFNKAKANEWNNSRALISELLITCVTVGAAGAITLRDLPLNLWSVEAKSEENGVVTVLMDSVMKDMHPYKTPNDYTASFTYDTKNTNEKNGLEKPDVILIVNETFCDLSKNTDVVTDENYLKEFYSIDGAYYGTAVTPCIGGGTNETEFELLTSHSNYLLESRSPFTYIDMSNIECNVVQYFKTMGYWSTGMHDSKSSNYNRMQSYPAIGFDSVVFAEDFKYDEANYNRPVTDSSNYRDLIDYYNNTNNPQLIYLLTYQNHGGYNQNDNKLDTVHISNDYGKLNSELNEYLSSVKLSSKAFKELTDYFTTINKPVIICMVGDHTPAFISKLNTKAGLNEKEKQLSQRTVPYVMWSNYGVDFSESDKFVTTTDIVPLMLKSAKLPMTAFYNEIVDLHSKLPIRSSIGLVMDNNNIVHNIEEEQRYYDIMRPYLYMEYNSLVGGEEYRKELFEIQE